MEQRSTGLPGNDWAEREGGMTADLLNTPSTAAQPYIDFLAKKAVRAPMRGLDTAPPLAEHLFPFQRHCVEFALRVGTAGIFLDTGLGKTEIQLEWCKHGAAATNGRALILTPLAVAGQTKRRADRWGYEARVIREQSDAGPGINIINYDRIDKIDPSQFGAVSLDEASILKSFMGKTTSALIDMFRGHRFKMAATATPAPNDHRELGNYAEFLEIMAANEMLSRFFINDTSNASQQWRLKGHAVGPFWDWMGSWCRMAELPSDLGDKDDGYNLPPFKTHRHKAIGSNIKVADGDLFGTLQLSATNLFAVKRQTMHERAKVAAGIIFSSADQWTKRADGHRESQKLTPCVGQATLLAANTGITPETHLPNARPHRSKRLTKISDTLSGSDGQIIAPCSPAKTAPVLFAGQDTPEAMENFTSIIVTPPDESADFCATNAISALGTSWTTPKTSSGPPTILTATKMPAWVLWCDTNDEQKALEELLGDLCISIYGAQTAEQKEALHESWLRGDRPILITKPSIFGFGVDWAHCSNMIFVGRTFSYETFYQAIRRRWRFGQKRELQVHIVVAEGEAEIGRVIDRKADDHAAMKRAMREAMRRATASTTVVKELYNPKHQTGLPQWLKSAA